jgi:hypothetical protein
MDWIARQSHLLSSTLRCVHPLIHFKWLEANRYNKNATAEGTARLDAMVKFCVQLVAALHTAVRQGKRARELRQLAMP